MNIHEILSVKLFAIILGYPQGIIPYNNPVYVGRGIALGLADTQRCLDTFVCPKKEKKKVFFLLLLGSTTQTPLENFSKFLLY